MKVSTNTRRRARRSSVCARWAILLPVFALGLVIPLWLAGSALSAPPVDLGNAESFGALSATAMTNAGQDTVVGGDIGSATSIDGGVTNPGFARYGAGTPELAAAQASLLTAYGFAEAQAPTGNITGSNLAGQTLVPGVYNSTSGILIDGPIALTLDGGGDPDAVFIFQAASAGNLIVESTASVAYTNGAQPCNVFWKVNSAFLRNTGSTFIGSIMALTQITLTEDITVEGRLLALNADVTFIHDTVNVPTCATAPPETTTAETTTAETTTAETTTAETTTPATTPGTTTPETTTTTPTTTTSPAPSPTPTPVPTTPSPTASPAPGPSTTPAPNAAPSRGPAAVRAATARRAAAERRAAETQRVAAANEARSTQHGTARPAQRPVALTG